MKPQEINAKVKEIEKERERKNELISGVEFLLSLTLFPPRAFKTCVTANLIFGKFYSPRI